MRFFIKTSYESFYAVWRVVSLVADLVYKLVSFLDKWLSEHDL